MKQNPDFSAVAEYGFLPAKPPKTHFPATSRLAVLDELGNRLPEHLLAEDFRTQCKRLKLPLWEEHAHEFASAEQRLGYLRLYYIRLGFLASAYVNQLGQAAVHTLPQSLSIPLYNACQLLNRPPILSYDGYALYNWKRLDPEGAIELGNIDTIQNFVTLYDEHWFILVHVEIEAMAAGLFKPVMSIIPMLQQPHATHTEADTIDQALLAMADIVQRQKQVLQRIPEHMDPALYFKTFRPYIRYFDQVRYEGLDLAEQNQRGETGAQSSIIPALVALLKIPHKSSMLTDHLLDMRNYMPARDRAFIEYLQQLPDIRGRAGAEAFNALLDAIAEFRSVHYTWAREYIEQRTDDPHGTGGTPYMQWLKQLIDETLDYKK